MSAPTTERVLVGLAVTASARMAHLAELDAGYRLLAHAAQPLTAGLPGLRLRRAPGRLRASAHLRPGWCPMTAPTITEAKWLLAVQAKQADMARAVLSRDTAAVKQLRVDIELLQAWRPGGAQ